MAGWIKVCGVRTAAAAEHAIRCGADAIGLNLWSPSPRSIDLDTACAIAAAIRGRIEVVAVTVDMDAAALQNVLERLVPDRLQLHGSETDALVRAFAPRAFKAVGLADATDVERAVHAPGPWVLVDARDPGRHGGTGNTPPDDLVRRICASRAVVLAGGLGPSNVAAAIETFRPAGVDAASGLERRPGRQDPLRVAAYVRAARAAFAALG